MKKLIKSTYYSGSVSEVTGETSSSHEETCFAIDALKPGDNLFPDSMTEYSDGNVKFEQTTPAGVIISAKGNQKFKVVEGETYTTSVYTRSGNDSWRYKFEIINEQNG